jgi:hypothetical protein
MTGSTIMICVKDENGKIRPISPDYPMPVTAPTSTGCRSVHPTKVQFWTGSGIDQLTETATPFRQLWIVADAGNKDAAWLGPDDDADAYTLEAGQAWAITYPIGERDDLSEWYATGGFVPVATTKRARSSNVATITTGSAHGLENGDVVAVSDLSGTGYNAESVTVVATPTATSFTYANTGDDEVETVDTGGSVKRCSLLRILHV